MIYSMMLHKRQWRRFMLHWTAAVAGGSAIRMGHRAIIVGAGIAGLSAALALRKASYDVTLYEQAAELKPMGAALSIWGNAVVALDWLGVGAGIETAAPITHLSACHQDGRPIVTIDVQRSYAGRLPVPRLPTRTVLQSILLAGLGDTELILDHKVAAVDQSARGATISFTNGVTARADVLIVADGIWSPTAQALLGTVPKHAGYGGVLALSDPAPGAAPYGMGCEYWGKGERFGLFDLGEDRRYWFFMRNEASSAETYALTMPDIETRLGTWHHSIGDAVRATPAERLIPFSIHAKPAPKRLGQGRIICVGDAAHAMEPNMGQGGCQSLEDAMSLGIAAQDAAPEAILPRFEAVRLKRIGSFVAGSKSATPVAQSRQPLFASAARAALRIIPDRWAEINFARLHRLPETG
jgi:2-polyprenyl-6-methoxyphenol hydroxylase-like FAD-dependent oxidoreductase